MFQFLGVNLTLLIAGKAKHVSLVEKHQQGIHVTATAVRPAAARKPFLLPAASNNHVAATVRAAARKPFVLPPGYRAAW